MKIYVIYVSHFVFYLGLNVSWLFIFCFFVYKVLTSLIVCKWYCSKWRSTFIQPFRRGLSHFHFGSERGYLRYMALFIVVWNGGGVLFCHTLGGKKNHIWLNTTSPSCTLWSVLSFFTSLSVLNFLNEVLPFQGWLTLTLFAGSALCMKLSCLWV